MRGRNTFRLSFGWENLENIEEQPSVFVFMWAESSLHTQTCSCVCNLNSCVCRLVLECVYLFFSLCMHRILSAYMCRILWKQGLSCVHMAPDKNPNLNILAHFFTCFSFVCNFNITLHHFWTQMYVSCHIPSYYASNIIFSQLFSPDYEFNLILFCWS